MRILVSVLAFFVFHMVCLGAATPAICIRLEAAGWSGGPLALTLSGHHVGFGVVAICFPRALTNVGLRSALSAASLILCVSIIIQNECSHAMGITSGRVVGGAATALACLAIESSLGQTGPHRRGFVLGLYMILGNAAYSVGTTIAGFYPGALPVAAISAALGLVPAVMSPESLPFRPITGSRASGWLPLIRQAPHAISAALAGGSATTAMLVISPLQATRLGLSPSEITIYLTSIVLAGTIFPVPLGILADRFSHHQVLQYTAGGAGVLSLFATIIPNPLCSLSLLVLSTGLCFSLYPLGLGIAQSRLSADHATAANSGLLLAGATGSVLGAPLCGAFIDMLGPPALGLWVAFSALFAYTLSSKWFTKASCNLLLGRVFKLRTAF
ncbi:MAG: hypothetical protein KTR25_19335 [Myxococcales bacterium]|nr:hypothetical protein [Myxococcales bacterium]